MKNLRIAITGASSGVGLAAAHALAAQGAEVFLMARRAALLEKTVSEIQSAGGKAHAFPADVSDYVQVKAAFEEIGRAMGGLDVLINAAALPANNIFNTPVEEWPGIVGVNLCGYMYTSKEAVGLMRGQGSGHIINVGSLCIRVLDNGCDLYVATKVGVQGFTDSLRKEVAPDGIAVTLINPGQIASGMVSEDEQEKAAAIAEAAMLTPDDVAEVIAYCISQPSRVVITELEVRPRKQVGL